MTPFTSRTPVFTVLSALILMVLAMFGTSAHAQSKDHTRIAFVSDRDGNYEIYSMEADGSDVFRLTQNDGDDLEPDWSPDGAQIAFRSYRGDTLLGDIYIMDAHGSNIINITNNPHNDDRYPSWSPDGQWIAFSRMMPYSSDIYVVSRDGSDLRKIVDGNGDTFNIMPTWSPDGTEIMFSLNLDPTAVINEVYSINKVAVDGSSQQRISAGAMSTNGNLDWSWANDQIAYFDFLVWGWAIYVVDKDITNVEPITTIVEDGSEFHENPSWSPDGSSIVYEGRVTRQLNSDIYIVDVTSRAITNLTASPDYTDIMPDWQPATTQ